MKLLYQQGYIVVRDAYWLDMLKWLQNPEYYSIYKKYNFVYFIRISEYEAYKIKSSEIKPICDLPLKYIHHIYGKDIIMNFTNLDNICEFVRRSVLDLDPKYCLNKIILSSHNVCRKTVCDINKTCF